MQKRLVKWEGCKQKKSKGIISQSVFISEINAEYMFDCKAELLTVKSLEVL